MSAVQIHCCAPENFADLSAAEQARFLTLEQADTQIATISGHLAIACQIEGFEDVAVATTNIEVEEYVNYFLKNKKHAKDVFAGTYKEIVKHHGKVDELYEKGGEDWGNFCNDIMLWSVARCVLLKKPIPILSTLPKDAVITGRYKGRPQDMPRVSDLPEGVAVVSSLPDVIDE